MSKVWRTFHTPTHVQMQTLQRAIEELSACSLQHEAMKADVVALRENILEAWALMAELAHAVRRGEIPTVADLDLIIQLCETKRTAIERIAASS